jgi:cell division transport system ATP-binding protein
VGDRLQALPALGFKPVIELYHVVKRYEGAERAALDDVNLKIGKGEFCLLTGPSGAGKTTLLRLLFCAEVASRGQVMLGGKDVARIGRQEIPFLRRNLGVVFQDFKLLDEHTVLENVGLALEVQGRGPEVVFEKSRSMLAQVGLAHKLYQPCSKLSGGEQQRVAIARALVTDPAILLADEPTGNLDPERSEGIMELLLRANARGTTVLVATHDPALLERYQRRVITLRDGKVVKS